MRRRMEGSVKVRFAPSPTGHLHIGGARTALFNYLYARKHGGKFILRIEDTDRKRSDDAMTEEICESLRWLGFEWDGEIVFQSQRTDRHREIVTDLIESGSAYRCFCDPGLLEEKRKTAQTEKRPYRYDKRCRSLDEKEIRKNLENDKAFAVRFAVPEGKTIFNDYVYGELSFNNSEISDFIILRRDGTPTYMLAVVADDMDLGITHVSRGDDHLSNTPKQTLLFRALKSEPPVFAHLPLILGPDGKRLSKRHGATSVIEFKRQGILPDALVNHLALLGWSPKDDTEFMSRTELMDRFRLENVSRKSAIFDYKKLLWLNGKHLAALDSKDLLEIVAPNWGVELDGKAAADRLEYALDVMNLVKLRGRTIEEIRRSGEYFFKDPEEYDEKGQRKRWSDRNVNSRVETVRENLILLDAFTVDGIEDCVRETAASLGVPAAELIHPIRLAISGTTVGPGLFDIMVLLGKETVLRRIDTALERLP